MKIERALAWYCRILLDSHQHLIVSTVGRDGLPLIGRVAYRRDGDDLFLAVPADAAVAPGLGAVGPVAGLLVGGDSLPLVRLAGAAELADDPDTVERLRSTLPADGATTLYRLLPDTLVPLQRALEVRIVGDGEAIVRQGEIADRFYIVLAGACAVSRVAGGDPQELAALAPGGFFGDSGLLAGAPRNASVHARGEATVASLSRNGFSTALHHTGLNAAGLAAAIYAASSE